MTASSKDVFSSPGAPAARTISPKQVTDLLNFSYSNNHFKALAYCTVHEQAYE
jgi:hypothetical protein